MAAAVARHMRLTSLEAGRTRDLASRPSTAPNTPSSQNPITTVFKHGVLHHAFPRTLAPYPASYDKRVLDADSLDLAFQLQLTDGSPSTSVAEYRVEDPKTHPRRCLDIGCGSGDWILAAAQKWHATSFVGLDLVCSIGHQIPLHLLDPPSAQPISPSDSTPGIQPLNLRTRIEWVQGNFLKPLPFADGEFDYIHVSGIARGVPEDKWDALLAEISRVLAVNGYLEIIEEDVIFPILPNEPETPVAEMVSFNDSLSTRRGPRPSVSISSLRDEDARRRLSTSTNRFLAAEAPKPPPVPSLKLNTKLSLQSFSNTPKENKRLSSPQSPSKLYNGFGGILVGSPCSPQGTHVKRDFDPAIPSGWEGPPEHHTDQPSQASSKKTQRPRTAPSITSSIKSISRSSSYSFSPKAKAKKLSSVFPSGSGSKKISAHFDSSIPAVPPLPLNVPSYTSPTHRVLEHRPSLLMMSEVPRGSRVKHDHQLLQTLFYGVYERRFINTTPTAILPSLLSIYFQGVSVSPPIDFPNPPLPNTEREACRKERRNAVQRECGSGGLEYSKGLSMNVNVSRPSIEQGRIERQNEASKFAQTMASSSTTNLSPTMPYKKQPFGSLDGEPDATASTSRINQLRKARSSPGISSLTSFSSSSRGSTPSFSGSVFTRSGHSPSSRDTSLLPTPISPVYHFESCLQDRGRNSRDDHGMDEFGISPDYDRFVSPKSSTLPEGKNQDEEEDARFAIMGDGGYFQSKPSEGGTKTLSHYPSFSSLRSSSDENTTGHASAWYEDDEDMLEMLTRGILEDNMQEPEGFDQAAAEELGVYDGFLDLDETEESVTWDQRETGQHRIYVRPRATFTGLGIPIPGALLELDDLSMGLHLTRAWLNVVACKEAMWDELQRRAKVVALPIQMEENAYTPQIQRVRRTTLLDEIEWSGLEKRMSDREKFELLFHRFEDDMRHWAAVSSALPANLSWCHPGHEHIPSVGVKSFARRSRQESATSLQHYSWDDGRGPGQNGLITPGLDVCRTLRVFTARKVVEGRAISRKSSKITGMV